MMPQLKIVNSNLPEPPYPADTQAGSFPFEIDVNRLVSSDTWDLMPADVRPWWVLLLTLSWKQVPCGSYRNDMRLIAAKIGASEKFVQVHQETLLRGWITCSDNRIYHPYIIEKVQAFLATRLKWRSYKKQGHNSELHVESTETPSGLHPSSTPSSSSSSSSSPSPPISPPSARATKIPPDWEPNQRNLDWLKSEDLNFDDIRRLVVMFRNYWMEVGKKYANWDLVFQRNPVVKAEIVKMKRGTRRFSDAEIQEAARPGETYGEVVRRLQKMRNA